MSHATMSLIGLYNFCPDLFDDMSLPAGIDRDLAINSILLRCGEQEVLYSDPRFLKPAIGVWSDKHYFTFDKWKKALDEEFNPLYNYDRHEEYTDNKVVNEKTGNKSKNSSVSNSIGSNTSESEDKTSAFDSATYQPKDKNNASGSSSMNDVSNSVNDTEGSRNNAEVIRHDAHLYGNIGVTTSVAMLKEFTGFYKDFNIYEQIAGLFADEFIIGVF